MVVVQTDRMFLLPTLHAMKTYREVEVNLHKLSISTLDWGDSVLLPGRVVDWVGITDATEKKQLVPSGTGILIPLLQLTTHHVTTGDGPRCRGPLLQTREIRLV